MKYKAIIDTDDIENFEFFEDGIGKYMVAKDANACAGHNGWIPLYFKEVEKELALDKVRAEIIERDKNIKAIRSDGCCFFTTEEVLDILDKYRAECES